MSTVMITGASRGIGRAIAEVFAKEGHNLIINCNSSVDQLKDFQKYLIDNYKVDVNCLIGDVADIKALETGLDMLNNPSVDILINNAGISYVGLIQDMTSDEWNKVIGTNLTGLFNTCKLTIPKMLNNHYGKIINISSVWGEVGASMEVAYSASKGGVNAYTKALAKELAPSGICVNAISCGYVNTEMNNHLSEDEKNVLFEDIPVGRAGDPVEIAKICLMIANSPEYLTGQIIRIDGAWI